MIRRVATERPQDCPDRLDVLGHLRGRMLERDPEPILVHPLHLRAEAEDEPALRVLRHVEADVRHRQRRAAEGDGDRRAERDPLGRLGRLEQLQERVVLGLPDPQAVVAVGLHRGRVGLRGRDAVGQAPVDLHRHSLGRPSTRSPTMLRWISLAPP